MSPNTFLFKSSLFPLFSVLLCCLYFCEAVFAIISYPLYLSSPAFVCIRTLPVLLLLFLLYFSLLCVTEEATHLLVPQLFFLFFFICWVSDESGVFSFSLFVYLPLPLFFFRVFGVCFSLSHTSLFSLPLCCEASASDWLVSLRTSLPCSVIYAASWASGLGVLYYTHSHIYTHEHRSSIKKLAETAFIISLRFFLNLFSSAISLSAISFIEKKEYKKAALVLLHHRTTCTPLVLIWLQKGAAFFFNSCFFFFTWLHSWTVILFVSTAVAVSISCLIPHTITLLAWCIALTLCFEKHVDER